jgi:Holliday junction DNA helicase RuvA
MAEAAMIGRLKGVLAVKQPPWLFVDVGGVGYELEAPMSTISNSPLRPGAKSPFTHTRSAGRYRRPVRLPA